MRRATRRLIIVGLACLGIAANQQSIAAQAAAPHTVLAIHWGPPDFPTTPLVNDAIKEALSSHDVPIDYFTEYLESDRVPAAEASQALAEYIRAKYRGRRIDVVFAVADPVLRFAIDHRRELFPDAGVVFSGVVSPTDQERSSDAGVTGVLRGTAYGETLKIALDLHPDTEQVFVVARNRDNATIGSVRNELRGFSERVKLTYMDQPTLSDLVSAVKALPPRSLVLFIWYLPDDPGFIPNSAQVVEQLARVSPVPIYGTNERYVGSGVVAGVVRGARETGVRMGEMALQIINGTPARDIPFERARLIPTFDWRQIRRWGIDPSRLPDNTNILFRTPTAWESYRSYIVATVIVVAAQLLLITGLLTQRAQRRRAEEATRTSEATLRTSYERIRLLAGGLINAQEAARAGVARDLHDDVCQGLAGVSMTISSIKSSWGNVQDPAIQDALSKLYDDTMIVFQAIRRVSHDLHPATLRLLGLGVALKAHCAEISKRHGVQVSFKADVDLGTLPFTTAVCLFRIAQESVRNAIVHGEALRLAVSVGRLGEDVVLTVSDDGRGFDLDAVRKRGSGLGLVSMEERAHVAGGDVEIVTGLRQGTTIRVRCPVREDAGMMATG
jgi:signal transduction histidine kinase